MAIIVGVSRGWIARGEARRAALDDAALPAQGRQLPRHLAALPERRHRQDDPFSRKDDGGDLVETSFLLAGLLCARQYLRRADEAEARLRSAIDWLWPEAEWSWHTQGGRNVLYWHWSPNNGWSMNHEIRGWNECLITYVLAASAPRYPIAPEVYHRGWADGRDFLNGRVYDGTTLPLGPDWGGPLFLSQYSFLGLDPRGLSTAMPTTGSRTWRTRGSTAHYCVRNPRGFKGYGRDCWGLTASDSTNGYDAHSPTNDRGVISPTAALAPIPTRRRPRCGRCGTSRRARRADLGRIRLRRRLQRDRRLVRRVATSPSTRDRSSS